MFSKRSGLRIVCLEGLSVITVRISFALLLPSIYEVKAIAKLSEAIRALGPTGPGARIASLNFAIALTLTYSGITVMAGLWRIWYLALVYSCQSLVSTSRLDFDHGHD